MHRLPFVHRAPSLRAATPRDRSAAKGGWLRRIDYVYNHGAGLEAVRIQWHGVTGVHP